MRRIVGTLTAVALVFGWVGFVWPGEEKDARGIIDKAIKAVGGEAKLAKHKAATWKSKGTYYGMGDGLPFEGAYANQWPDQFRMDIENAFVIVLNGDKGWISSGGETKDMSKDQHAAQLHDHRVNWMCSLLPLKDKAFELKSLGEAMVDKEPADVVQVSRKGHPEVKMYFSKKSHLMIRSEYRTKSAEMQFKEVTMQVTYGDYRAVDGVKHSHKQVMKRDGKIFVEAEMSDFQPTAKLDAKTFAKPRRGLKNVQPGGRGRCRAKSCMSIRSPDADAIARAAHVIQAGGLVAFPTETVYGLGANALDPAAVSRIFAAKGRPSANPIIVHVAAIADAKTLVDAWPALAQTLAERFWPGPLTLVLGKQTHVPDLVTAGGPTIALRMPAHPVALALLRTSRVPLAAPSATVRPRCRRRCLNTCWPGWPIGSTC